MEKQGLIMKSIGKQFNGVTVLEDVDFDVRPGEIHGLLGENGAGKSTLMKIVNGVLTPSAGEIYIDGGKVSFDSPHAASRAGIRMVYQELDLFAHLTAAENICQGNLPRNGMRLIDWPRMKEISREILHMIDVEIDVDERLDRLSIAQQQIVAIARALNGNCRIILLDEPTSALPKKDVENLFKIVRQLKEKNISVVFISHKLDEMMEITDRITILNNGKKVATVNTEDINEDKLAEMVVGRTIKNKYPKVHCKTGETLLKMEHISLEGRLNDVSFELKKGEVLGIVGLLGAGKTEIAKALFGVYGKGNKRLTGNIYMGGRDARFAAPAQAVKAGIGYISEDRGSEGLQVEQPIDFNISLAALRKLSRLGLLNLKKERDTNERLIDKLKIKCETPRQKVSSLSGGNQQKVVIAKWFATEAKIVVLDEPTRGIDIGAKVEVYNLINEMVEAGIGVLLLSSEVPEVFGMADRILVLKDGRITGEMNNGSITEAELQRQVM